jgi:hypothetical protein
MPVAMGPEIWVALAAMFVSGGAVGTAGTLLTQWIVRRFDGAPPSRDGDSRQVDALRAELSEMGRYVHDLDTRLDFTERLLDGALAPAPARTSESEPARADARPGEPRPDA